MIQIERSKQLIFNKVAKHLMRQKTRSQDKGGNCMYRCGALMCAAGVLIPKDSYSPKMEGKGWPTLVREGFVSVTNHEFVTELQMIHDDEFLQLWRIELIGLAKQHKLNYKFLEI
jgi:hypothetical protein